jgi:hypothetical protein
MRATKKKTVWKKIGDGREKRARERQAKKEEAKKKTQSERW